MTDLFHKWMINGLRRLSYRWPGRYDAKKDARVMRNCYKCAKCKQLFTNKEVQLDHIRPVIPTGRGFTTWDTYIKRLFVDKEGYQVMCKPCHKDKTTRENARRKK